LAAKGNPAANIFLAKNLLGYRDYFRNEHSGPEGSPIAIDPADRQIEELDLTILTVEELEQLQAISRKLTSAADSVESHGA
jgi:hypothetical protein